VQLHVEYINSFNIILDVLNILFGILTYMFTLNTYSRQTPTHIFGLATHCGPCRHDFNEFFPMKQSRPWAPVAHDLCRDAALRRQHAASSNLLFRERVLLCKQVERRKGKRRGGSITSIDSGGRFDALVVLDQAFVLRFEQMSVYLLGGSRSRSFILIQERWIES